MQLLEWGVTSKTVGVQHLLGSVGITDTTQIAHTRVLEALESVPLGHLARGWITTLALCPDRLTYDRLETVAMVTRDREGVLRWYPSDGETAIAEAEQVGTQVAVIDGAQLRRMRRARGLSQENLAWTAGLGLTTLARLESQSQPRCRYRTINRLAVILGENPRAIIVQPQAALRS
jgi:hypothetical protein